MRDQDFQNMILTALEEIKEQSKERYDRLEKRLDTIETQREKDNERLEKRLDAMETHVAQLRQDVGWGKRKLEGRQAGSIKMLNLFNLSTSITAIIIALIALFS